MNHAEYEELLALELYGELDADERRRLEAHSEQCTRCQALRARLEAGLGGLRVQTSELEPLPLASAKRRGPLHKLALPAASFAAGVLVTLGLLSERTPEPAPRAVETITFARATSPPPANARGSFVRLAAWLDD